MRHEINPLGAARAIEDASEHDGRTYGSALYGDEAVAILRLISVAGYDGYTVQQMIIGLDAALSRSHLRHLDEQIAAGVAIINDIHELGTVHDAHPDVLAGWLDDNLNLPQVSSVLAVALNNRLTTAEAAAVTRFVPHLDGDRLVALAEALSLLTPVPCGSPTSPTH